VLQCVAIVSNSNMSLPPPLLQCVAACSSLLQCVVLQCVAFTSISNLSLPPPMSQCVEVCLLCVAVCCSVLQCVAVCCSVLQCVILQVFESRLIPTCLLCHLCCSALHCICCALQCVVLQFIAVASDSIVSLLSPVLQCDALYLLCVAVCCVTICCSRV